jgi:hypothetical protein
MLSGMVAALDESVGNLSAALHAAGMWERTLPSVRSGPQADLMISSLADLITCRSHHLPPLRQVRAWLLAAPRALAPGELSDL